MFLSYATDVPMARTAGFNLWLFLRETQKVA
jgi:hypothetical protein